MGGGPGPTGPSKADRDLRKEEMRMQQAQFNMQMAQQAQMAQLQQQQAEQARQDAMADRKRIEEQQRQAAIEGQNASAAQLRRQQESKAQQELSAVSNAQTIADQQKKEEERQAALNAGAQATGAGYNLNAARKQALVGMGGTPNLPATEANQATSSNVFTMPKTTGLQFGGT
jgi:hypothetical protein